MKSEQSGAAAQSLDEIRQARLAAILAHTGTDRAFITGIPLRNCSRNGVQGFEMTVRLTSYRSLPLSCISEIRLRVDGEAIKESELILVLDSREYRVEQFRDLSTTWWFILDTALLFVPRIDGIGAGEHDIEGTLVTVEPYMTAGRFAFYSSAKKRLPVQS